MAPARAVSESEIQETRFSAADDATVETVAPVEDSHGLVLNASKDGTTPKQNGYRTFDDDHVYKPDYGTANANGTRTPSNEAGLTNAAPPKTIHSPTPRVLAPDLLRGLLMVLQAIDHCSVSQGAWRHGVALQSEGDGTIVNTWNEPVAWTARMLTHLCAPGFMFLLGMGVVYLGNSRRKLGWSAWRLTGHFAIRAFVLAAVNQVFITLLFGQGKFAIINPVLIALAIDYLIAGLLWVAIDASESLLATLLEPTLHDSVDEGTTRPLLPDSTGHQSKVSVSARASSISWHLHNVTLLAITIVTLFWNHWVSPHQGHCPSDYPSDFSGPTPPRETALGPWFDFWFLSLSNKFVVSPFPPLGWLSAAILGLLYARIALARTWKPYTINAGNVITGMSLLVLFVLTRLLHFGNLSEDCLHMPEQLAAPGKNQYLASFQSFFYITKYPPSMSYVTLTMAVNFLLLGLFGALPEKVARRLPTLLTFGQSALFFYIIHMALYFGLAALAKQWFGHELGYTDPFSGKPAIGTSGKPAVMWITWLLGLAILLPLCRWYGRFKSGKGPNSVWRFF